MVPFCTTFCVQCFQLAHDPDWSTFTACRKHPPSLFVNHISQHFLQAAKHNTVISNWDEATLLHPHISFRENFKDNPFQDILLWWSTLFFVRTAPPKPVRTPAVVRHLVHIQNVWAWIQRNRKALKHSQAPRAKSWWSHQLKSYIMLAPPYRVNPSSAGLVRQVPGQGG